MNRGRQPRRRLLVEGLRIPSGIPHSASSVIVHRDDWSLYSRSQPRLAMRVEVLLGDRDQRAQLSPSADNVAVVWGAAFLPKWEGADDLV